MCQLLLTGAIGKKSAFKDKISSFFSEIPTLKLLFALFPFIVCPFVFYAGARDWVNQNVWFIFICLGTTVILFFNNLCSRLAARLPNDRFAPHKKLRKYAAPHDNPLGI